MTSARRTDPQPQLLPFHRAGTGDAVHERAWPMALRALMLLSEASQPSELARLSDDELAQLRATLVRLNGGEPTSAA